MKIKMTRKLVLWAIFLSVVLGGRILNTCDREKYRPSNAHRHERSQTRGLSGESVMSERDARLQFYAQRLRETGRCDSDRTARAAAEALEVFRDMFH